MIVAALPVLADDARNGPEHDLRWFRLGAAYSIAGDAAKSLAAYERQLELDPFAEHVRKVGVWVLDRTLPVLSVRVLEVHTCSERSGTVQGVGSDQVFNAVGLHGHEKIAHPARLELEYA